MNLATEVAQMQRMTLDELRGQYAKAFGEPTRNRNRVWLVRRIAWRLQALAEGDLSERARRRAEELAHDADLRMAPPRPPRTPRTPRPSRINKTPLELPRIEGRPSPRRDRLPPPGSMLARRYRGDLLHVKVLAHGFEFAGAIYKSLSAVARAITGSHCNGFHFFRLTKEGATR